MCVYICVGGVLTGKIVLHEESSRRVPNHNGEAEWHHKAFLQDVNLFRISNDPVLRLQIYSRKKHQPVDTFIGEYQVHICIYIYYICVYVCVCMYV